MKKLVIWIIVLIIIGVGIWLVKSKTETPASETPVSENMPVPNNSGAAPVVETQVIKEFTVIGTSFAFAPATLNVRKGDTVKITFKDNEGFHDLKIDGYNVATARLQTGGEATVEFLADKAGSFAYYCSVGNHREQGMTGTLTVAE